MCRDRKLLCSSTFGPALPQLSVLDEASEHLGLHEDAQEAADALGGHRLAEGLALEDAFAPLALGHEQGVMADGLQEEADERLRNQAVQGVAFWAKQGERSDRQSVRH